jgi:hypothetical protein
MSPIRLTDDELSAVFTAAGPIPVNRRDAFLQDVAKFLRGCAEVGPGHVHRAIEQAQRQHFDPPVLGPGLPPGHGKYR